MRPLAFILALGVILAGPARAGFDVIEVTSPLGIRAWLAEDHTIPILTIDASFLGGTSLDPAGKEGTTALMATLLDEGAGPLDSAAFATAREDLAARIGFDASRDHLSLAATMLTENRDATIELLRQALTEPRFDPEPVERMRAQALASIRMAEADPSSRAAAALAAATFPDHPYGRPEEGTAATVTAASVADLRASHDAALTRDHLRIAVVGDIAPAELGPLLDRLFGGLPATGPALPPVATPHLPGGTGVLAFDTPQSIVFFGDEGLPTTDPDFIPAIVMTHILGGAGLETRLNEALRARRGLTYGAYAWLDTGAFGPMTAGTFSSSNARVGEALSVLRDEWRRMAETGVSAEELARAKRYLTGAFLLTFDGNESTATQLLGLLQDGREVGYINERNTLVEAVTTDDVARVARRLLDPDRLTAIVAGRPEGLPPAQ